MPGQCWKPYRDQTDDMFHRYPWVHHQRDNDSDCSRYWYLDGYKVQPATPPTRLLVFSSAVLSPCERQDNLMSSDKSGHLIDTGTCDVDNQSREPFPLSGDSLSLPVKAEKLPHKTWMDTPQSVIQEH